MALSLAKGDNLSLSKVDPGLNKVLIGLGWDARTTSGAAFDLDASAILVTANGKVRSDADFIFYGQKSDAAGSVVHQGDNRTGAGDGDDEQILIDLGLISADIDRVVFAVSIDKAHEQGVNFGQVRNSFIRVVNASSNEELANYELGEEASTEIAVLFSELYRYKGEWKFRALGKGYADGIVGIGADFGVTLG